MDSKSYCIVSGVFFSLVAALHLLRIAYGVSVDVEGYAVPVYFSWFGFVVPATLAAWAFRTSRRAT